jgi:hypothetical protein
MGFSQIAQKRTDTFVRKWERFLLENFTDDFLIEPVVSSDSPPSLNRYFRDA